jgi:hypothetical protein
MLDQEKNIDEEFKFRELMKQIKEAEMELEWAEAQASNDFKYIRSLEKQIENLYEQLDAID